MKKISFIGVGYVGLVTGVCFAELGNEVICVGRTPEKIDKLNQGIEPFYEPGLKDLLEKNLRVKRLRFTTNLADAVKNSEIIFIAVGTPEAETGEADLTEVKAVATAIGKIMEGYKIIVNKSTVPVGTGDLVRSLIAENYAGEFDVVSCPEFLREGSAIKDCLEPDRQVVGVESERAQGELTELFQAFNCPVVFTNLATAELTKYAANSLLATEISFINNLSRLCERTGADITKVSEGMRLDKRIGPHAFVSAGIGYGGACFPKDVSALAAMYRQHDVDSALLDSVQQINTTQKASVVPKIKLLLGDDLRGKTITLWGLAFKPNTDDVREAPSRVIIRDLLVAGARVKVYDPVAMEHAKKDFDQRVIFSTTMYEAVTAADLLVLVTEWPEFKEPDFEMIKTVMKQSNIVDGRNFYNPHRLKSLGFAYLGVGRG